MSEKESKNDWPLKDKILARVKTDRFVAGVCGGLGKYFEIDSLIFRLIFILLTVFAGSGVIIYIIFWILMPEEGEKRPSDIGENIKEGASKMAGEIKERANSVNKDDRDRKSKLVGGLVILTVGLIFLFENIMPQYGINFSKLWPMIVVVIGISVIIDSSKK